MKKKDSRLAPLDEIPKDLCFQPERDRVRMLPVNTWSCLILDTADKVAHLGGKEGFELYYYLAQYLEGMQTKYAGAEEAAMREYVNEHYVRWNWMKGKEFAALLSKYGIEIQVPRPGRVELEPVDIAYMEVIPGYKEALEAAMEVYNTTVDAAQEALDHATVDAYYIFEEALREVERIYAEEIAALKPGDEQGRMMIDLHYDSGIAKAKAAYTLAITKANNTFSATVNNAEAAYNKAKKEASTKFKYQLKGVSVTIPPAIRY